MQKVYVYSSQDMMGAVRSLYDRGEITLEQYASVLRRNKVLSRVSHKSHALFLQRTTSVVRLHGIHGNPSFINILDNCGVDHIGI